MTIDKTPFHGTAAGGAVRLRGGWAPISSALAARGSSLYGGFIAPTAKSIRGTALSAAHSVVTR